ncbi:MAG: pyridine nucleotide-disulfide oxidoreductase [Thermoplasmata archaeon]|nr:MAG: pyridine nucleotide-disulfide oxidoreductase [Thermoplasmata archaeon]
MENTDVLIIGGSASGIVTAVTGKSNYPDKTFMVVRKEKQVVVPCGIPYIFGSLDGSDKNLIPDTVLENPGIKLKVDEAISVDLEKKICKTSDGTEIGFDKLVFATGSDTKVPNWLKGADKENVFTIPKDKIYLDKALSKLKDCKKIVVVGGGFIGVEVSDELNKKNKDVTIVEILPHVLSLAFDKEMAVRAEEILKSRGVKIKSGVGVKEILGDNKPTGVLLDNGETLDADAVILSIGYSPNTNLAKKAGLELNEKGFIKVGEYMRTENPNIFAVGDCAEKKDFFTRKTSSIMLASTACAEARIAGMSLYKLSAVKTFGGTIAIFSTAIGDTGFGVAGLTEDMARKEGFDIVEGSFEGIDKHPGTLPGTNKQMIKLVVAKDSGMILGGGVIGGLSAGELTNILGFVIQNKMTINSLLTAQIGTHPLVTAPPTAYPLIKAAEVVSKKL